MASLRAMARPTAVLHSPTTGSTQRLDNEDTLMTEASLRVLRVGSLTATQTFSFFSSEQMRKGAIIGISLNQCAEQFPLLISELLLLDNGASLAHCLELGENTQLVVENQCMVLWEQSAQAVARKSFMGFRWHGVPQKELIDEMDRAEPPYGQ